MYFRETHASLKGHIQRGLNIELLAAMQFTILLVLNNKIEKGNSSFWMLPTYFYLNQQIVIFDLVKQNLFSEQQ